MEIVRGAFIVVLAALCGVSAGPAAANFATASLDWEHFEVFALGIPGQPTPTFSLSGQTTTWQTSASTVLDSSDSRNHGGFNWTSALDIKSDTPKANAEANASDKLFATSSSALSGNNGDPNVQNQASASLTRSAVVTLSGPAALVFSVPYSIVMNGPANDFSNHTQASVGGTADFAPTSGSATNNASRSFSFDSLSFEGPVTQDGTLFFGLVVDGAGVVNAQFTALSSATAPDPIPEPAAALGLVVGLIGVSAAALRRRVRVR